MTAVEFEATRADMAAFQRFVTGRIRGAVRSPLYFAALVLAAVILGGVLASVPRLQFHPPTAVLVLLLGGLLWWMLSRLYRHAALPLDGGSLIGPRRIELSDEGVAQVGASHEGRTRWSGVLSVDETPGHVFLMTDRLAGYIIPTRAFVDAASRRAFVEYARARAGRR